MNTDSGNEWSRSGKKRRRTDAVYLAVILVILLEVVGALYLYSASSSSGPAPVVTPPTVTSKTSVTSTVTTTTTTSSVADSIKVESASITNDTLILAVHNYGPSSTTLLTLADVCSPKFATCYGYTKLAGAVYQTTFDLPAKDSFTVNLTRICVVAIPTCKSYLPVANATYYYQVSFTYADGSLVTVPITATATNTWSPYPTAIIGIDPPSLTVNSANLTGLLNVTLTLNGSLPYASWTTRLDGFMKPLNAFSGAILANSTGCVGSPPAGVNFTLSHKGINVTSLGFTADCTAPVPVMVTFTTVLTGVSAGPYFAVVVTDTTVITSPKGYPDYGSYATFSFSIWIKATS